MYPERPTQKDGRLYAGLAAELLKLEQYWLLYLASGGRQGRIDIEKLKGDVCKHFGHLFVLDSPRTVPTGKALNLFSISEIVAVLEQWDVRAGRLPMKDEVISAWWFGGLAQLVFHLKALAGIPKDYLSSVSWSSGIAMLTPSMQAMRHHLPPSINYAAFMTADSVVEKLNETSCIAVFGDIRKSQDLMYNTLPPEDFFRRTFTFTAQVKDLATAHGGVFDKFTGDGFLALFSEGICRNCGTRRNYIDSFLDFVQEVLHVAEETFEDWIKHVSKVPEGGYGLGLGADLGAMAVDFEQHELRAVGRALVWASRMTGAANPGELVVNNQLKVALEGNQRVTLTQKPDWTKHNESFVGWSVSIQEDEDTYELLKYARQKETTSTEARSMFEDRKKFVRAWDRWTQDEWLEFNKLRDSGVDPSDIAQKLQRTPSEINLHMSTKADQMFFGDLRTREI